MGKARIIKKQGRCFVELPKEFLNNDEIEFFELREGYYLLSVQLPEPDRTSQRSVVSRTEKVREHAHERNVVHDIHGTSFHRPSIQRPESDGSKPTEEEIAVLRKLLSIRFGNRTPEYVSKTLNDSEKQTLVQIEKKGWAHVFKGRKYKNGVYSIPDNVYPLLKTQNPRPKTAQKQQPETGHAKTPDSRLESGNYSLLLNQGYLIIRDQRDAKALSEKLKSEMKSGSVLGVKGFDGAFYVVTKDYFSKASKTILDMLGEEADVTTITQNTKLETDGIQAVLRHLAESGEVIEKKRGVYIAV